MIHFLENGTLLTDDKVAREIVHGPYIVIETVDNGVTLTTVDRPQEKPIRIAMDLVRRRPKEIADTFWPERKKQKSQAKLVESEPDVTVYM